MKNSMDSNIPFEIELISPPPGVGFSLQKGKDELVDYQLSSGENIRFRFSARVKKGNSNIPNFLGEYCQGTPSERFVYVCVGEYAGQDNSEWARRVKIHLSSVSWIEIDKILVNSECFLAASYLATDKNGGPSCASVPLIGDGWSILKGIKPVND